MTAIAQDELDLGIPAGYVALRARTRIVPEYRKHAGPMEASAAALGCRLDVPRITRGWEWGGDPTAILVTNNATETAWWQSLQEHAIAVCFALGRLNWKSTLQGQTVLYFGADLDGFRREFRQYGPVWRWL